MSDHPQDQPSAPNDRMAPASPDQGTTKERVSRRMTRFTVYDPVTGEILRTGYGPAHIVAQNAKAGEAVLVGQLGDIVLDRVEVDKDGAAGLKRRPAAEIEARRLKPLPPAPSVLDVLEAMRRRGIELTSTDLQAARASRLQRERSPRALDPQV